MKLLNKTQGYYLSLVAVLLAVWTGVFLYVISSVIKAGIDETLQSQMQSSISRMKSQPLSYFTSYGQANSRVQISVIDSIRNAGAVFSDTTLYNKGEKERIPYRQISAEFMLGGHPVKMVMRKSTVEYDDLFYAILLTELLFVAMLILSLYLLNRQLLQKLWRPFFGTLHKAEHYRITQDKSLTLPETNIQEFNRLNEVLMRMTERMEHDYQRLKQFTENASHEIQTPLSVISNKAEILLQDESLTQKQGKNISDIHKTAGQLSRLNKALLILTKIENGQFIQKQDINFSQLLKQLLPDYQALAEAKTISVKQEIDENIHANMNTELAELMFRNLLGNAVKHNIANGRMQVQLTARYLRISNTSADSPRHTAHLFERFHKGENSSSSLGLGLAIVSAITDVHHFELFYTVDKNMHTLEVQF